MIADQRRRKKTVRLHPTQKAFRRSNILYRGFVGGRGAGKSWIGAYDLIRRARPGRLYLVASPTYTVLADTTFRTFRQIARELGVLGAVKVSPPSIQLTTGAEVIFRSADDPERLRGPNLSGVWLDEASLMHRDAYEVAIACLREGGEQGWLSATFTPKGLTHWTYDLFGKAAPDTEIFHAATRDNPFNPAGFHDTLAKQYSGLRAEQELEGRFVNIDGAEWPAEYFPESIWFTEWPSQLNATALSLDPAQGKGEKGKGCYASFVHAGIDAHDVLWCEAWMSRDWDAAQMIVHTLELNARLRPQAVSVETNGGQEFLAALLLREARRKNVSLPLHGICNVSDKEVRIRAALGHRLAQGKLRFRRTTGTEMLVQQLRDFPVGEFKDGPDCLEMSVRMLAHLLGRRGGVSEPKLLRAG